MKIGIITDSHDRIELTQKALKIFKEQDAKAIIHCGDFCAPFMMNELAEFDGEVHCVFGNIDDRFLTPNRAKELGINFHGDIAELEFDGKKIAVNHYPELAEALASTGKYDAVFYGHNHEADKKKINNTLLLNAGELMARKTGPSIAIYNTETNDAEIIKMQ
ncbi:YfcE family phosphodiesterase [Candidatus Pacearchaeota archaeon]|nr:YfcE family phosphodiesterase [Candidatus Pacearchaeota archaeon]|tara:strand:- start:461 stop:946 length:486 start_codon:yes stop_codon:yes gene_type:complete